ncbi:PREDICTED: uncharacterized protein LOC109154519 isoform X2 [Ipomoea nil]|uniref:uncharacterized protein LOC109154519 isoform X2 n=1 Tax=Ipomoea nil TaxID=35883 RepID=UPI000901F057|nr:PREDICTED: uncharacterized protein LOC109154519 isoform X2 [Ipomoea nil]
MASPASRQPRLLPPSKLSRPPVAPQIAHVFNFAADLRALLNITEDYVVPFLSSSLEATTERFCTSFLEISVHEYSGVACLIGVTYGVCTEIVDPNRAIHLCCRWFAYTGQCKLNTEALEHFRKDTMVVCHFPV